VTVWQETVTFPLLQCPKLVALPSQQGSVSAAPKAHFQIRTWVAQRTKLCPLSSSQDSTIPPSPLVQPGLHNYQIVSFYGVNKSSDSYVLLLLVHHKIISKYD